MASGIGVKLTLDGEQAFADGLKAASKEYSLLTSEMKAATATMDKSNRSVEDITKQNEILTRQIAAQADKVKILEEAYKNSASQLGENDSHTKDWLIQLNNAKASLGKLETQLEANNNELVTLADGTQTTVTAQKKLEEETAKAEASMKEQQKAVQEARATLAEYAQKGVDAAAKSLEALAASTSAAVTAISALVLNAADAADELGDLSNKTGISVEKLQEYDYAAEMLGTSLDTITGAQAKLIKDMSSAAKGTGEMAEAFRGLGVSVTDSNGNLRDSEEVFTEVIDALGAMQNETERDAAAMKIFGKSAQDLNPLIKAGSAGLAEYTQEARDLGLVMSEDAVSSLGSFQAEVKRVRAQVKALKNTVAGEFTPVATELAKTIQGLLKETQTQLQSSKMKQSIQQLGKSIAEFTAKAVELGIKVLPKVADAASFVVKNFNVLAISLGTLLVLFKGAGAVANTAKAFTALSTALQTLSNHSKTAAAAGTELVAVESEMTAANTALNASMLGVIGIAAALGAAIAALCISAKKRSEEQREALIADSTAIEEAIRSTVQIYNDAKSSYESTQGSYDATAQYADKYIKKLEELESYGKLSETQQAEYNATLRELQALLPDINIQIDKQTGFIKGGTKALKDQITQWREKMRVEALSELMTAALKKQIELQMEYNDALTDYRIKREKLQTMEQEYSDDLNSRNYDRPNFEDLRTQVEEAERVFNEAKRQLDETEAEVNQLSDSYNQAAGSVGLYADATQESTVATSNAARGFVSVKDALDEYYSKIDEYSSEHAAILTSTLENMFSVVDQGAEYTMQQLTETLRKNAEAAAEWSSNLRTIYERGASADFVEWLESQGIGYANAVKTIAESTQAEFDALTAQWQQNKATAAASGYAYGTALAQGIGSGIIDQLAALKRAARQAAQAIDNSFTNYMQIASPSKLFRKYGRFTIEGYNQGLEDIPVQWPGLMSVPETPDLGAAAARLAAVSAGAGASYTYNYYVSDPSPEYYEKVMQGVNQTFGGVAYA